MKTIRNLFLAGALALASVASAQQFTLTSISANNTNLNGGNTSTQAIAAASANIYNASFSIARYDGTAIQLAAKLMGAGTSAITACFDASADGTNWVTPYTFVTVNANGTTAVCSGTNLVNQHWQFLRLRYVTNASNEVLTNLQVQYVLKPRRNG